MAQRDFIVWHSLKNEHGNCSFAIIEGTLYVRTHLGSKCTQLGGMPPHTLATILMKEITNYAKCGDC
jgi:hypothetical protein